MKKLKAYAVITAFLYLTVAVSCGTKIESTVLSDETENITSDTAADVAPTSDEKEENSTEVTKITSVTSATSTSVTTSTTVVTTTEITETTSDENTETTAKSDSSAYNYDLSDAELISKAQSMFDEAVSVYSNFIYDCAYSVDDSETYFSDSGESMLKITDSSVTSVSDVVNDFEQYFSEKYESPVPMVYIESGSDVYYIQTDIGGNTSYLSTTISEITKKTENEVFFTAISSYDDGTVRQDTYSLVYGENGVEWKTGVFNLPN